MDGAGRRGRRRRWHGRRRRGRRGLWTGAGRRRRLRAGHRARAWRRPRRGAQVLRIRAGIDQPVGRVVVRVGHVAGRAAGPPLEARTGRRRSGRGPFDEAVRGVAPANGVDRIAPSRPHDDGTAGCRDSRRVCRVGAWGVDPGRVRDQDVASRTERRGHAPAGPPGGARAGRRGIGDLEPVQVERAAAGVRELDELIRGRGTAGHDLGDEQAAGRRPGDARKRPCPSGRARPGGAAASVIAAMDRTRMTAAMTARRARIIDDLPAGIRVAGPSCSRAALSPAHQRFTPESTAGPAGTAPVKPPAFVYDAAGRVRLIPPLEPC